MYPGVLSCYLGDEYGIHIYSIPNLGTEVRYRYRSLQTGAEKSAKRELLNIEGGKIKKGNNVIFDDLSLNCFREK